MWKKTGSTFRCCKPKQELQLRSQEHNRPESMCLRMTFGRLKDWLERNGIYAGRIHYVVHGLDCVVSFSRGWSGWQRFHGVATSTMFSNLTMSILLHGARCIGDGDNYSGPQCMSAILILNFFCMISSISKGGVKYRTCM